MSVDWRKLLIPRDTRVIFALFLVACVVSTAPLLFSGSVPGFQQDWSWPLSRQAAFSWLSSFVGQWSSKGLGQPNLLPLQTYLTFIQVALVTLFGASGGLAIYLVIVEVTAFLGLSRLARQLGATSAHGRAIAAAFYAFSPAVFSRTQAGHLAYLFAYMLLPWIVSVARTAALRGGFSVIQLGLLYAGAASQVQFLFFAALAALLSMIGTRPTLLGVRRIAVGLAFGVIAQLQGLLPLLSSSARVAYRAEKPILAWALNNSVPPQSAAILTGYFTHYFERYALPGTAYFSYAMLIGGLVFSFKRQRTLAMFAIVYIAVGISWASGLIGPLAPLFTLLSGRVEAFSVFRDYDYATAMTALGTAIAVAKALEIREAQMFAAVAVSIVVFPTICADGLRHIVVPKNVITETSEIEQILKRAGPGRALWLPSEGPVGLASLTERGIDIAEMAPSRNATANALREPRMLAYATQRLRKGTFDSANFRRLGITFVVARQDIVSDRSDDFGTHASLAFPGRRDDELDAIVREAHDVVQIGHTAHARVYRLLGKSSMLQQKSGVFGALRFPQLAFGEAALLTPNARPLTLPTSTEFADPRTGWVSSFISVYMSPAASEPIYADVMTTSEKPLAITASTISCVLTHKKEVGWRSAPIDAGSRLTIFPRGETIVSGLEGANCVTHRASSTYLELLEAYDSDWLLVEDGHFTRPVLADGWAMAWRRSSNQPARFIYLPAVYQGLAFLFTTIAFLLLYWNRRRL